MNRSITGSAQGSGCSFDLTHKQTWRHRLTPFRSNSSRPGIRRVPASKQEVKTAELPEVAEAQADAPADSSVPVTVTNEQGEEIYLGFEKGDFQPREGRKGRTIVDDAERYPSRSEMSGGWAGGEVGLQQFVERAEDAGMVPGKGEAAQESPEAGKAGSKSPAAQDDPAKYPSKDSIGPFSGVTGGFAGGERGVQQYVEEGDLKLAPPGRGRQFSPLIIAGGVAVTASLGGLLLDDGVKLGEEAVEKGGVPGVNLSTVPIDDNTKLALQVAVALLGVVVVSTGVRALVRQVQDGTGKLAEKALDIGKIGIFWVGVFVAVKFVLESS